MRFLTDKGEVEIGDEHILIAARQLMRSEGMARDQGETKVVDAVPTGSEIESTLEACRGWLAMQTTREGCLTTAGDIIDDLRFYTDSPERFRAAVFPNAEVSHDQNGEQK